MSMSSGCGARRLPDGKSSVCSWAFSYSIFFVVFRRGPVGCPPASRNSDRFLPRSTDRQRNSHDFDPDEGRPELGQGALAADSQACDGVIYCAGSGAAWLCSHTYRMDRSIGRHRVRKIVVKGKSSEVSEDK